MWTSAKLSKFSFRFLAFNLLLVIGVAALRPVFARQEAGDPIAKPEVELPPGETEKANLPANPARAGDTQTNAVPSQVLANPQIGSGLSLTRESDHSDVSQALAIPPVGPGTSTAPINPMVLDEIRKVIQDSHGELDVPPLSYPALPLGANRSAPQGSGTTGSGTLEDLALRMRSIAAITQSAQALIKEAQHHQAKGQVAVAGELLEQVRTLNALLSQLSADSRPSISVPNSSTTY